MPKILGMGTALPTREVGNEELSADLGRSAEEIERQSGVRTRFYAEPGEGPSELARRAATEAFEEAGTKPEDIGFLVFATMTPDVTFPGSGCYLQDKLGCGTIGALDLRAQCCGFLFALDVADQFLRAGAYRRILLATGEVHSSGLDFSPAGADVTPLFGDGAAVAVLGAEGEGIVRTVLHTDATALERFWCEFPSSRRLPVRFLPEDFATGKHFPRIDAEAVKTDGRRQIRDAVEEVLAAEGASIGDVKHFFLHHVYGDVAAGAADDLGIASRATVNGKEGGHIASASLPMAFCNARRSGTIRDGDLVCLATAGSGANWGATLLRG